MEHTELINRILEVERTARALSDEALERQAHLEETLAAEKAAVMERYISRAKGRLERLEQSEQAKKDRALAALDTRLSEASRKMELSYSHHVDNWVETMFHQVVDVQ